MLVSKQLLLHYVSATDGRVKAAAAPVPTAPAPAPAQALDRRWLVFAIVSIGLFMASIDQTNVMVSQHVVAGQGSATGS
jgi:hypothetical protein